MGVCALSPTPTSISLSLSLSLSPLCSSHSPSVFHSNLTLSILHSPLSHSFSLSLSLSLSVMDGGNQKSHTVGAVLQWLDQSQCALVYGPVFLRSTLSVCR